MAVATQTSTSLNARRIYPRGSHPPPRQAYESDSNSTASDTSVPLNKQRERRQGRAEDYNNIPGEHRTSGGGDMSSHTVQGRYSDSKPYKKDPVVTVQEVREGRVRRIHGSEHRHRHHRSDRERDAGCERIRVYRDPRRSGEESDRARPNVIRRSTVREGATSRTTNERPRRGERRESHRRDLERRSSRYKPIGSPPLRREKRSVSDEVPRSTRDRVPVRSVSARGASSVSIFREPLTRSQTTSRKERPASHPSPTSPYTTEKLERWPSTARGSKSVDRSSGFFGAIFGAPKPARPPRPARPPEPERQVECITCLGDDIPVSKSAKLPCDHRMCHSCLRRIFTLSTTDPQHMPPTCCTSQCIDLKHVERLFDNSFKKKWNRKYQEYTTKNRIYCPARGCGEWIKPSHIHIDTSGGANGGRKYGKCPKCKTKVCCTCNNKWHTSRECPKDAATQEFIKIAKKEGWQRCFNCSATVELKEGCNHMTCRCRAEFCMICGLKWKTCDCPWFNYAAVEADRLNHMNVPFARRVPLANQARGYQEELDRRRDQELRDEALARRIQFLGLRADGDDIYNADAGLGPLDDDLFLNRDFARRAADIISGTYNTAGVRAAERLGADLQQRPRTHAAEPHDTNLRQEHTPASREYNNRASTRPSERVVPRRVTTDYETEAARHRPVEIAEPRRASLLAGISRGQTVEGRVDEWRRHVDPLAFGVTPPPI